MNKINDIILFSDSSAFKLISFIAVIILYILADKFVMGPIGEKAEACRGESLVEAHDNHTDAYQKLRLEWLMLTLLKLAFHAVFLLTFAAMVYYFYFQP